jgi:hypothetical protein
VHICWRHMKSHEFVWGTDARAEGLKHIKETTLSFKTENVAYRTLFAILGHIINLTKSSNTTTTC